MLKLMLIQLFKGTAAVEDRSLMNVTFVLNDESLSDEFLEYCKNSNLCGIKGHRTAGGFRATMYNAMPEESVDALVAVMKEFSKNISKRWLEF